MDIDEAREIVARDVSEDTGVYVLLRLGQKPDPVLGRDFCIALRTLWRTYQDQPTVPTDVIRDCATILFLRAEAIGNLGSGADAETLRLLNDINMHAYGVLMGRQMQMVFRIDLHDNAEYFRYKG